jgi:hypothetical protein
MTEVPSGIGRRAVAVSESKSSSPSPVKMCVANDGQREPATRSSCSTASASSAIDTPGTTSGAVAAIVRSTASIARPIASSSSADLMRRSSFTSRDPVRTRWTPRIRARLSVVSAQMRSPTARTPEPAAARATRSKAAKPSSVSFTTTISPPGASRRSNAANIRGSTNTGSAPARKKAPVTQPCA